MWLITAPRILICDLSVLGYILYILCFDFLKYYKWDCYIKTLIQIDWVNKYFQHITWHNSHYNTTVVKKRICGEEQALNLDQCNIHRVQKVGISWHILLITRFEWTLFISTFPFSQNRIYSLDDAKDKKIERKS